MNSRPSIKYNVESPSEDEFTPLQEHQEQTPSTFFGAKPVLYFQTSGLELVGPKEKLQSGPAFAQFSTEGEDTNEGDVLARNIDVWVTSEEFILAQQAPSKICVRVPYPLIALHAVGKRNGVNSLLMNIYLNDPDNCNAVEDIDVLEISLLPSSSDNEASQASVMPEIFQALNKCAELHPDSYDDEDAELDLTAPGATGWITADNMDEFTDESGNFMGTVIGGEELGPGAGTVRQWNDEEEEANGVNGANGHEEKYQRTG